MTSPAPARAPATPGGRDRDGPLAALRRRIAAVERSPAAAGPALDFGIAAVDRALPGGGLASAALHEFAGEAAALAVAALLAGRRQARAAGPVLWCPARPGLYPPGLCAFGLEPERLILVRAGDRRGRLWAMEQGLASGRAALVVGEVDRLDLTASRRLQLAAEGGATPALLLSGGRTMAAASAALTRWHVESAASGPTAGYRGVGRSRFRLALRRCRGGRAGAWLVEWDDATHTFTMAAALGDRPALPRRARG